MAEEKRTRANIAFAAIDPYLEQNIVLPTEKPLMGKDIISWGDGNAYPDYLAGLVKDVPTLASIISGTVDFICGDDIEIRPLREDLTDGRMNNRGDDIRTQVSDLARDWETYGGFALQVIRDFTGAVAEIYYLDMRYLRTNKDCDVFWYCEDWKKGGRKSTVLYPAFIPGLEKKWGMLTEEERNRQASSVVFVKNTHTQVYPMPPYGAAVKACETERCISDFHLSSIQNCFTPSMVINFNNGVPDDKIKEEVEANADEKFGGPHNGARVMYCWNDNKESATTIDVPKTEDFGARYEALAKHVRQQIFTSFAATPNLFGLPTDGNGFSNDEYAESFKLYNRTRVVPVQQIIGDAYDRIYGDKDVLSITPFSMGDNDSTTTLAAQLGVGGTQAMMEVVQSTLLSMDQKKGTLQVLFGLDDESVAKILGLPYVPPVEE